MSSLQARADADLLRYLIGRMGRQAIENFEEDAASFKAQTGLDIKRMADNSIPAAAVHARWLAWQKKNRAEVVARLEDLAKRLEA